MNTDDMRNPALTSDAAVAAYGRQRRARTEMDELCSAIQRGGRKLAEATALAADADVSAVWNTYGGWQTLGDVTLTQISKGVRVAPTDEGGYPRDIIWQ